LVGYLTMTYPTFAAACTIFISYFAGCSWSRLRIRVAVRVEMRNMVLLKGSAATAV